jgi:general secretion pathway protein K
MKIPQYQFSASQNTGIALIVAMISILALSMMAGALALMVKVETRLAYNLQNETDLAWIGRSAVEYARWLLAEQLRTNQWDDESLWSFQMELGTGKFIAQIEDLERKININIADQNILTRALALCGVNAADIPVIVNSVLDWIDPDSATRVSGAESEFYQRLQPPCEAKNGPLDDISELLLIRGITPELYWGHKAVEHAFGRSVEEGFASPTSISLPVTPGVGLVDLFTPVSIGLININTASKEVLQVVLGVDPNTAARIIEFRNLGEGFEERKPVGAPGKGIREALLYAGFSFQQADALARYFTVRGSTFRVHVVAERGMAKRSYTGIILRNNPNDVRVLAFYAD